MNPSLLYGPSTIHFIQLPQIPAFYPSHKHLPPPTHEYQHQPFQHRNVATILGATPRSQRPSQTLQHSNCRLRRKSSTARTLGHLHWLHPLATPKGRHRRDCRSATIQPRPGLLRQPNPRPRHPHHKSPSRHRPLCKDDIPAQEISGTTRAPL